MRSVYPCDELVNVSGEENTPVRSGSISQQSPGVSRELVERHISKITADAGNNDSDHATGRDQDSTIRLDSLASPTRRESRARISVGSVEENFVRLIQQSAESLSIAKYTCSVKSMSDTK